MANVDVTRTGGLMTACTQPGCTGTIVDGYCDVCGSPSGAVPFVSIEGLPPKPKNAGLETACTQPGCTGMIVDCYCDVCGSPAGAVPFVPAKTAASALDEEAPRKPIRRVRMPAQQLSTQEPADPGSCRP
jgi:serine/threonine-protein kinase PknG